ncbi:hypothetical protein AAFP30_03755 [Gordonia sp. CPCC 205515]|uniref:hypothetical protein n=1 Tax=Gordonia sp. CPCC 205515 TaxID=3140791 RepID=UPI003AF3EBB6
MYPRPLSLTVAAVLFLGLTGCGSDATDTPAASSSAAPGCTTDTTTGREDAKLLPIPPATVTVLDAGQGARRTAGAAPNRDSAQSVTLVTTSSVASAGERDAQTVEMPLRAQFSCTDSTDLEMTLGAVTAPDPILAEQLQPVEGSRAGLAIGPGAMPISLRLLPAEQAGPEARSAVEQSLIQALQLSVPLPTEPIASGARWRVERTINAATTITQHIDATLTSWTDDRLVIDVTVDQTPTNSVFAIPGSADTLTIGRYTDTGTGQITVDLGRGLPVAGTITMSGARELVGADPNKPLLQQTGLSVQWR